MAYTLDNFVRSTLSVAASATDTTLLLAQAAAPLRDPPNASVGSPGVLVLQDLPAAPTKIEVVHYTAASLAGTTLTLTGVTRAQEGTTAQAWTAGTPTFQGITSAVIAAKLDATATAAAATKLATARNLNGTAFDGTADVTVPSNVEWGYACSDETTALTTGTKVTDRAPKAMTLAKVKASLTTASSSGLVTVDVKKNGVSLFSTLLTIDATEKTSATAATAAVLATTAIADDDELTLSVTGAGTGAAGLKVHLIGTV